MEDGHNKKEWPKSLCWPKWKIWNCLQILSDWKYRCFLRTFVSFGGINVDLKIMWAFFKVLTAKTWQGLTKYKKCSKILLKCLAENCIFICSCLILLAPDIPYIECFSKSICKEVSAISFPRSNLWGSGIQSGRAD